MDAEVITKIHNINKTIEVWGNYLNSGGIDISQGIHKSNLMNMLMELYGAPSETVISKASLKATREQIANQKFMSNDRKAIVKVLDDLIGQCPDCGHPANGHDKNKSPKKS